MWRRTLLVSTVTAVAASAAVLVAGNSQAAVIGSLAFTPATGADTASITVTTSGPCTDAAATNLQAKVFGAGFPESGQVVVSNSAVSAYSTSGSGGYIVPLAQSMRDFANQQASPATLSGKYDFVLTCRTNVNQTSLGDFTGSLWFTSNTAYQSTDPSPPVTPTTTTLTVTPASPQQLGTSLTLQATVAPDAAAGSVQFKYGATNIGTAVAVAMGTASLTTSALPVGTHPLTAVFTPSSAAYSGSTSAATSYVVTVPPPAFKPVLWPAPTVGRPVYCFAAFDYATSLTYTWRKNGVVIPGATASTYVVPEALYHHYLSCTATGSNASGTVTGVSRVLKVGVGPALRPTTLPYLYGTVRAGYRVYCKPGAWTPAATSYLYRWYVGTRLVSTASSIVPPATWRGQYLKCHVTARRTAWTNGVASSRAVRIS